MSLIKFGKTFKYTLLAIAVFEVLSLLGWYWPAVEKIVFWFIVGAVLVIAWLKFEVALWIVLAELIIGSKGYLFSANIGSFSVSIRLGIFGAIIFVWLVKYALRGKIAFYWSNIFWWYLLLIVALGWGILIAFINHHPVRNIFLDVNGYLYFGLAFVIYEVIKNRDAISRGIEVVIAGITGIAVKTILLLVLFSARADFLPSLYRWVRDTRVNEITLISHNFYRIFSQSQIYSLIGAVFILTLLTLTAKRDDKKNYWYLSLVFILTTLAVIISYSRSIWLALLITFLIMLVVFIKSRRFSLKGIIRYIGILVGIFTVEIILILLVVSLPNWLKEKNTNVSFLSLVEDRLGNTEQAGLQSRWNLVRPMFREIVREPVLGRGFGAEVTYNSKDPRVLSTTGNNYTTYSFEWGYLDQILKIGIIGLIIYLIFIWKIARIGFRIHKSNNEAEKIFALGMLFALLSIIITHATTPYLNHPLGIGFLLLAAAIFEKLEGDKTVNAISNAKN